MVKKLRKPINRLKSRLILDRKEFLAIIAIPSIILGTIYVSLGTWPFLYIVKSSSMEPALQPGDIVLIKSVEPGEISQGDVVVFDIPDDNKPPYIHRVVRYVRENEIMWSHGPPSPTDGFVTKGDNNEYHDQAILGFGGPVKNGWIRGRAVALYRPPLTPQLLDHPA